MPHRNKYENLPMAPDAIPHGAITLTEAFDTVLDAVEAHPNKIAEIEDEWLDALHKSREFEKTAGHDPEVFSGELEEYWHLKKVANVFLRLALENNELRACIRDPRSGETLQLLADGWVTQEWIKRRYIDAVRCAIEFRMLWQRPTRRFLRISSSTEGCISGA
jgi:hypothetical protein